MVYLEARGNCSVVTSPILSCAWSLCVLLPVMLILTYCGRIYSKNCFFFYKKKHKNKSVHLSIWTYLGWFISNNSNATILTNLVKFFVVSHLTRFTRHVPVHMKIQEIGRKKWVSSLKSHKLRWAMDKNKKWIGRKNLGHQSILELQLTLIETDLVHSEFEIALNMHSVHTRLKFELISRV